LIIVPACNWAFSI